MLSYAFEILMVEDNPSEARLPREFLSQGDIPHKEHLMEDGESGISFLRQEAPYVNTARPELIILDLNLPQKHGREV